MNITSINLLKGILNQQNFKTSAFSSNLRAYAEFFCEVYYKKEYKLYPFLDKRTNDDRYYLRVVSTPVHNPDSDTIFDDYKLRFFITSYREYGRQPYVEVEDFENLHHFHDSFQILSVPSNIVLKDIDLEVQQLKFIIEQRKMLGIDSFKARFFLRCFSNGVSSEIARETYRKLQLRRNEKLEKDFFSF